MRLIGTKESESTTVHTTEYLIEDQPQIRQCFLRSRRGRKTHILDLPLPWTYYRITNNKFKTGVSLATISGLLFMGSRYRHNYHNSFITLPLPNCGDDGYTCSPHRTRVQNHTQPQIIREVIACFWEETFAYQEKATLAAQRLHDLANVEVRTNGLSIKAFKYWEDNYTIDTIAKAPFAIRFGAASRQAWQQHLSSYEFAPKNVQAHVKR